MDALTAREVRAGFDALSLRGAGTANRMLAVLSSLMRHTEEQGLRPDHAYPCRDCGAVGKLTGPTCPHLSLTN